MSLLSQFLHQIAPKDGWGQTFITSALGALAGGLVASRSFTKRAVVAEHSALSAAAVLCFSISNKFLALKKQHVLPLKERFETVQREFEAARNRRLLQPGK